MASTFTPIDQAARDRILDSLDETLFVEAGAGTGKTTSLVGRIVNLVARKVTTIDRIAAITFTEAAAAELRDGVRQQLERSATDPDLDESQRKFCAAGVADIDLASIQTLHGFAAALLQERPLEAGLPPSFEIMDPIAGDIAFEEKWSEWLGEKLTDAAELPTLPLSLSLGLRVGDLRAIALRFHGNYDLIAEAKFDPVPMPVPEAVRDLVDTRSELDRLCRYSKIGESDTLFDHVQGKLASIRRLAEMDDIGSAAAYRLLSHILPLNQGGGRQSDWLHDPQTDQNACKSLKELLTDLNERANEEIRQVRQSALVDLLDALSGFVLGCAGDRKRQGRAEYHDLLVWARDLLRDNIEARDHFRSRFTHLLIDEAQDTDPIQAEIAMFLAEAVAPIGPRPRSWERITPERGKLFVVGDPKQSIYRFRRADVRQMDALRDNMGAETVRLVQNFRSQRPVIDWVNHVFGEWMQPGGDYSSGEQAEYVPLEHRWNVETDHPNAPAVWALGDGMDDNSMDEVRDEEARAIAALLSRINGDEWQIRDESAEGEDDRAAYRPARFSDVCILMPKRTALFNLEIALDDALDGAGIPYRLEGASLVFVTQEVRDLLNCLKAIDDPADEIAIVAALRSPAFACTDVELLRFYESDGRFDYLRSAGPPDGQVADALRTLREYHDRRVWVSISALIDGFVRARPLMTAAVDHPRTREQWRRYRFVIDQARAFAAAGGGSLRAFLEWMDTQAEERARVTEVAVPESDEEAVRIMTVHGAKGLEFPVVLLTGISSGRAGMRENALFDRESGSIEVRVGAQGQRHETAVFEALAAREGEMGRDEAVRLLYVAATRAKDHLVISMFRKEGGRSDAATLAKILTPDAPEEDVDDVGDGGSDLWKTVPDLDQASAQSGTQADSGPRDDTRPFDPAEHSLESRDRWKARRERVIAKWGRPISVAATRLRQIADEARDDKPESDSDEPWRRGRAGTSIGRAVHAALQTVDLATGDGIDETARAQAAAEGIPDRYADIARLARRAVESEVVRRAVASGRFWREAPVGVPLANGVLEGFIDLLFETPDGGLVVVDYKTDSLRPGETADAAERYRPQAGAYAYAIQKATGRPVAEVVFLFLEPHNEESFTNIAEIAAEAEAMSKSYLSGG